MKIGTCTCVIGQDGSPCSHQLAVVVNFRRNSLNCIPTLHPIARKQLAYIAMGKEANNDISFYTALSQCSDEIVVADNTSDDISVSDQLKNRIFCFTTVHLMYLLKMMKWKLMPKRKGYF